MDSFFQPFLSDIQGISLPNKFTFPFYYEAHPLVEIASKELQRHIEETKEWTKELNSCGKMFGVLVVKNQANQLGYLCAVSGKINNANIHQFLVPPVYDMLQPGDFFLEEEKELNTLNAEVEKLESSTAYKTAKTSYLETEEHYKNELEQLRLQIIEDRKNRKQQRALLKAALDLDELQAQLNRLNQQSIQQKLQLRDLKLEAEKNIELSKASFSALDSKIKQLKTERKTRSNQLQQRLFEAYQFLNKDGAIKNSLDIFKHTTYQKPPAAAGECCAPKLLQHAFKHNYTPICMGEFWWGASPKSEIRKHGEFYPACQGKCKPILGHMLKGMELDENPLLKNPAIGKRLTTIYEDDFLMVIHKPEEFLSAPGKTISDSVYTRIKQEYPKATGPLIVHRLDMSTSGLMLIAKDEETYKQLQQQFIKRTVKKRYIALLDGLVETSITNPIDLPLRLDIDDRPRQLVCYEHGKKAVTQWEVIEIKNNQTRVYFYPITGRTHQLRVHASHPLGLNRPIVGDDLYGRKANRLHLHAEYIQFTHPNTKEVVEFQVAPNF